MLGVVAQAPPKSSSLPRRAVLSEIPVDVQFPGVRVSRKFGAKFWATYVRARLECESDNWKRVNRRSFLILICGSDLSVVCVCVCVNPLDYTSVNIQWFN